MFSHKLSYIRDVLTSRESSVRSLFWLPPLDSVHWTVRVTLSHLMLWSTCRRSPYCSKFELFSLFLALKPILLNRWHHTRALLSQIINLHTAGLPRSLFNAVFFLLPCSLGLLQLRDNKEGHRSGVLGQSSPQWPQDMWPAVWLQSVLWTVSSPVVSISPENSGHRLRRPPAFRIELLLSWLRFPGMIVA